MKRPNILYHKMIFTCARYGCGLFITGRRLAQLIRKNKPKTQQKAWHTLTTSSSAPPLFTLSASASTSSSMSLTFSSLSACGVLFQSDRSLP